MTTTQNPNGCSYCDTGANDRCQHTDEAPREPVQVRVTDLMHPPTR